MDIQFDRGPYLLALDESENGAVEPPTESLTGILIPVEVAATVRKSFNAMLHGLVVEDGTVHLSLPELHFSDLLPEHNDDVKGAAVEGVVSLVVAHGLHIVRVSYQLIPDVFGRNTIPWFGIQQILRPVLAQAVVLPVVDAGFDRSFQPIVKAFAQSVRSSDIMRALPTPGFPGQPPSANLGEVMFADSQYSVIVQMADVVAGLRRLRETTRLSGSSGLSSFQRRLLSVGEPLEALVFHDETTEMTWDGRGDPV